MADFVQFDAVFELSVATTMAGVDVVTTEPWFQRVTRERAFELRGIMNSFARDLTSEAPRIGLSQLTGPGHASGGICPCDLPLRRMAQSAQLDEVEAPSTRRLRWS